MKGFAGTRSWTIRRLITCVFFFLLLVDVLSLYLSYLSGPFYPHSRKLHKADVLLVSPTFVDLSHRQRRRSSHAFGKPSYLRPGCPFLAACRILCLTQTLAEISHQGVSDALLAIFAE
mgnify:FL=1|jgi:hypothetical protein